MTITSPEALALVNDLVKLDRAVLARELSLKELRAFPAAGPGAVPLEVFVHGALCVAYSGQCLTSEALGQRSANRGECAQACRMPYTLVVDGEPRDLGDKRYLLSPQDLAGHAEVPGLIQQGVASFKIEGRLKSPEYVAAVTSIYRKAIDAALELNADAVDESDRYALEMTFSRGLYPGWLHGVNHQELVGARYGKKRGAFLGRVARVGNDWVELADVTDVKAGDGIVFDTGGDTNDEQGGRVFSVSGSRLRFGRGHIALGGVRPGHRVWKTDDPRLNQELRRIAQGRDPQPVRTPLHLRVSGTAGAPLEVVETTTGARATSTIDLQPAHNRPLDEATLRKQLGRLGQTRFQLESLTVALEKPVMLPVSELNALRRSLVSQLESAGGDMPSPKPTTRAPATWHHLLPAKPAPPQTASAALAPTLAVLCRNLEQLTVAARRDIAAIYLDFEDIRRYRDAVAAHRDSGSTVPIFLATPRIQKPGEEGFFKLIERAEPDGVLIRNPGGIHYFRQREELRLIGDFSLNVANPVTAALLIGQGLERVTVSYDLNAAQIIDLANATPAPWLELTLHQHIPMFHMEHCVFCAFMSSGTDHTNCGRPCEQHKVHLRDRVGMLHPLAADVGCRNTLFQGKAQTGAAYFGTLREVGIHHFRIEFLHENGAEAARMLTLYAALLSGQTTAADLRNELKATSRLGVTEGPLAV